MSHLTDADYERLAHRLQELMAYIERLPLPQVRDTVFELLQGLDALHREALTRLLELLEAESPDLLPRLEADFALRTLLMLYEFIPPDEPEEPLDARPQGDGFVPLEQVDVLDVFKRPIWMPGGHIDDLEPDALTANTFDAVSVLLCRIGDEIFAMHNVCTRSILPLASGTLEGYTVVCPWHGCRYDLRTGALEGEGQAAETFPVRIGENGRFSVGFNIGYG